MNVKSKCVTIQFYLQWMNESTQYIQWFGNGILMQGVIRNSENRILCIQQSCAESSHSREVFIVFTPWEDVLCFHIQENTIVKGVECNRLNRSIALTRHSHSEWFSIVSLKIESQLSLIGNDLNLFNRNRNSLPEYTLPNAIHGFSMKNLNWNNC